MKTWKIVVCAGVLVLAVVVAAHAFNKNSPAGSCATSSVEGSSGQSAETVGAGCCPKKKSSGSESTEKSSPKEAPKSCPKSSDKGSSKESQKSCPKK